jgi:DNA-binding IclR family transcriptional regulator
MRVFAEGDRVISIKDVADRLNLPPSSVHRLLNRLVKLQIIQRAPNRRYRVGTEYFRLGALVNRKLRVLELAKPLLSEIARRGNETCQVVLYQPHYRQMTIAARIEPPQALHNSVQMYERLPLAWGAIGRVMLAWLDTNTVREALRASPPSPLTNDLPPKADTLQPVLAEIRDVGYARGSGQLISHDAVGIAAPFFDAGGDIAGCFSIVAPKARCGRDEEAKVGEQLIGQAQRLSRMLGRLPYEGTNAPFN